MFKHYKPRFSNYAKHIYYYQKSILQIEDCKRSCKEFSEVMEQLRQIPGLCNGLSLESILLMPIQRIPRFWLIISLNFIKLRYEIMFKDLLSTVDKNDIFYKEYLSNNIP